MEYIGYGLIILITLLLIVLVPWGFGSFQRTTPQERKWARERAEIYRMYYR